MKKIFFISLIAFVIGLGIFATTSFAANDQLSLKLAFPSSPDWDGYEFLWGKKYIIQWTAEGISTVDINLFKSGSIYRTLGTDVAVGIGAGVNSLGSISGRFDWIVPQDITPGSNYVIEVSEHVGVGLTPRVKDKSGLLVFSEKAAPQPPSSITVVAPNGGETWKPQFRGGYSDQTVRWNYVSGSHVDGYLYRTSGNPVHQFCEFGSCGNVQRLQFNGKASLGQATISLPENIIPANDYRIHLSLGAEGDRKVAEGNSDASFSISIAATSPQPTNEPPATVSPAPQQPPSQTLQEIKSEEEITNSLVKVNAVDSVETITQTQTSNNTPVYEVKAQKRARLFFIVPVMMNLQIRVDAKSGNVLSVDRPWWRFFAW